MSHLKLPPLPPYQKQQRKSYAGFVRSTSVQSTPSPTSNFATSFQLIVTAPTSSLTNTNTKMSNDQKIPVGFVTMDHQVAGHTFHVGTEEIGMLKSVDDGSVLKPAGSPMCAAREIKFYEQLLTTTDKDILPLRDFIAEYRGTQTLAVGSKAVNFIKLRDLTHGISEPCVIDIKMGRRTWDPLATEQKREAEENKYVGCKNTVGFCIPGLQTHHIASGTYKKFGKEYGKKLNQNTVKEALRLFLNADSGLCRQLIMQILTNLWAIQKWIRTQKVYQFYSSSILIIYDARKLRQILEAKVRTPTTPDGETRSESPLNSLQNQLKPNRSSSNSLRGSGESLNALEASGSPTVPKTVYRKIQRSHSSMNNYEQEMQKMKDNYTLMLDNLVGVYDSNKEWVHVKMIDFAHTFNNNEISDGQATVDKNYLDGIEHLVEMFEELLKQCD
ncbi:hypothetical protein ACKWTF_004943 [Chironomus riparius]